MPGIEEILGAAREAGASDVHLAVGIPPRMRVNGRLIPMNLPRMLASDTLDVLIGIMSENQREKFDQRGEFDFSYSSPQMGRCRVNAYKQQGNVAMAIRLVDTVLPSPEQLGIPESVMDLYQRRRGLVLVTGPAGSGKSTTLAAIVEKINNNRDAHVITIEDPIEYLHPQRMAMVSQREVGLDSETYASGLWAALREDPDVILAGELCGLETVRAAITAAETGRLVLSALPTAGAADTLERIIDGFPADQQPQARVQLANVLEAVVFQQLLPTADGKGRVAVFEVLHVDRAVRDLIREGNVRQLPGVIQAGRKPGMVLMDDAICKLYFSGRIDRETALWFAQDPESMESKI